MINVLTLKIAFLWHENVGSHPPKIVTTFFTNVRIQKFHKLKILLASRYMYTLDDSHHTGTTEIVQAIKSIEENIEDSKDMEIWDHTMYL